MKAKPFTPPTARKYSTAAARKFTTSEMMIVRRARAQPVSTADVSERPSRTSSRTRSKNTMNESAVMPIETMKPATPARLRR